MTQQCARTRCKNRREAPTVQREVRMADGVDAVMEAMQPPGRHRMTDGLLGVAELSKLADRHHSMLPTSVSPPEEMTRCGLRGGLGAGGVPQRSSYLLDGDYA